MIYVMGYFKHELPEEKDRFDIFHSGYPDTIHFRDVLFYDTLLISSLK